MKRFHFNKRVWLENGVPMTTTSGTSMQRLSILHRPTAEQTRMMLKKVRAKGRLSLSALGVFFGTNRTCVRNWLNGRRNASGPATRAIWLAYLSFYAPDVISEPGAFEYWRRPGIPTEISKQEFVRRVLKRHR